METSESPRSVQRWRRRPAKVTTRSKQDLGSATRCSLPEPALCPRRIGPSARWAQARPQKTAWPSPTEGGLSLEKESPSMPCPRHPLPAPHSQLTCPCPCLCIHRTRPGGSAAQRSGAGVHWAGQEPRDSRPRAAFVSESPSPFLLRIPLCSQI